VPAEEPPSLAELTVGAVAAASAALPAAANLPVLAVEIEEKYGQVSERRQSGQDGVSVRRRNPSKRRALPARPDELAP
jgi:hypothetical protein